MTSFRKVDCLEDMFLNLCEGGLRMLWGGASVVTVPSSTIATVTIIHTIGIACAAIFVCVFVCIFF